jgi:hypothetical protein
MPKFCSSGSGSYGPRGRGSTGSGMRYPSDVSIHDRTSEEACDLCDTREKPYKLCKRHNSLKPQENKCGPEQDRQNK